MKGNWYESAFVHRKIRYRLASIPRRSHYYCLFCFHLILRASKKRFAEHIPLTFRVSTVKFNVSSVNVNERREVLNESNRLPDEWWMPTSKTILFEIIFPPLLFTALYLMRHGTKYRISPKDKIDYSNLHLIIAGTHYLHKPTHARR